MRLLSFRQLREKVALSRTTIWRLERLDAFPQRRQLSPGRVGWVEAEVDQWLAEREVVERQDGAS